MILLKKTDKSNQNANDGDMEMMIQDGTYWISKLVLMKHPEGGYFRETYRADENMKAGALPERYAGHRSFSTAIYFLLPGNEVSHFHRLKSDELWHYYAGSSLTLHLLNPHGQYIQIQIGSDPEKGETFQALMPSGCWFGATVDVPRSYSLVGCTVAPGFDFADFELGERDRLLQCYPQHAAIIRKLTR